jgi:hypothetical protein
VVSATAAPRRRPAADSGFALLVALLVVFLVAVALSLIGLSLALRMRMAREEAHSTTLTALCDAALAEALAGVAAGQVGGIGTHPFGTGSIGSQVETTGTTQFLVTASASFGGRSRRVQAVVIKDAQGTRVVHWQRLTG